MTYGEKLVGVSFNPSGDSRVDGLKSLYSEIIDTLHSELHTARDAEQRRLYTLAIDDALRAQMMAVKAVTWRIEEPVA